MSSHIGAWGHITEGRQARPAGTEVHLPTPRGLEPALEPDEVVGWAQGPRVTTVLTRERVIVMRNDGTVLMARPRSWRGGLANLAARLGLQAS